jgi:short-chain fatty acids transporter
MRLVQLIEKAFKYLLPSPFSIAILLTIVTFALAFFLTGSKVSGGERILEIAGFWEQGLWNSPLLTFAVQMMLMLVLGHALALTQPVDKIISYATRYCSTTAYAAAIVTLLTILVALFNWGLGLVFGAILARKVGEHALKNGIQLNYPLVGAAGYSGMMIWHGGISGSAPIKVAEEGHLKGMMQSIMTSEDLSRLPDSIDYSNTIFGGMNITAVFMAIVLLPLFMYLIGKKVKPSKELPKLERDLLHNDSDNTELILKGAERIDRSRYFSLGIGIVILIYLCWSVAFSFGDKGLGFINPNFLNLLLLGLCLSLHRSIISFLNAIDQAIGGASGILIQFPLYFGIMGIMTASGLVQLFSDFFVEISSAVSFPVYTFFSAGLVNIFVPSGGGQWGVQGPIIIQAAQQLHVDLPKAIMALAYGDQLTNMLQPFWALPLLGITGLRASSILPYTLGLMLIGTIIFTTVLLIF